MSVLSSPISYSDSQTSIWTLSRIVNDTKSLCILYSARLIGTSVSSHDSSGISFNPTRTRGMQTQKNVIKKKAREILLPALTSMGHFEENFQKARLTKRDVFIVSSRASHDGRRMKLLVSNVTANDAYLSCLSHDPYCDHVW